MTTPDPSDPFYFLELYGPDFWLIAGTLEEDLRATCGGWHWIAMGLLLAFAMVSGIIGMTFSEFFEFYTPPRF
jgi:hypothetical protein